MVISRNAFRVNKPFRDCDLLVAHGSRPSPRHSRWERAACPSIQQQIVVDEYKRQDRRFRWIRFADASKQQVEALFSWRETLDSWHLWFFDQEAFEVIEAADNAYQQRLASVETTGVVLSGVQSQDRAAASGAAEAASSAADWLRPPTPPSASSTHALHCLVSDHQQRKDKCCEVPPRQHFEGYTLELRKRGGRAAGNGRHKDRGPHRHKGRGLRRLRDKDRLLLPLWNNGHTVLNPRLRGRAGHPGLPLLHGPLYWLHRTVYTL